jgi:multisubunit Na+/H+ antiporter MnhE subunit
VLYAAASLPIFYLFWIVFVGTFSFHELLIGVIGALLASTGLFVIDYCYPARFSPRFVDLLSLWRVPWYLVAGTCNIFAVAAKDLVGAGRAKSLFRMLPFDAGKKDDPHAVARRVLAAIGMTVTPNTIVLGVNAGDKELLFHEMGRDPVPQMLKELGARP